MNEGYNWIVKGIACYTSMVPLGVKVISFFNEYHYYYIQYPPTMLISDSVGTFQNSKMAIQQHSWLLPLIILDLNCTCNFVRSNNN